MVGLQSKLKGGIKYTSIVSNKNLACGGVRWVKVWTLHESSGTTTQLRRLFWSVFECLPLCCGYGFHPDHDSIIYAYHSCQPIGAQGIWGIPVHWQWPSSFEKRRLLSVVVVVDLINIGFTEVVPPLCFLYNSRILKSENYRWQPRQWGTSHLKPLLV